MQNPPDNSVQHKIAIAVAASWIIYLIYLLTAQASPTLGDWAGPPHLTSSVFLGLTLYAVLSPNFKSNQLLGWWTIVTSTLCIFAFECLQLLTPGRSFQFIDIAQGISGAAIAAMIGASISRVIGRSAYLWLSLSIALVALAASLLFLRVDGPPADVNCAQPVSPGINWELVSIQNFKIQQPAEQQVSTSIGSFCSFDTASDKPPINLQDVKPIATVDNSLVLNNAGLVSTELVGLRQALSKSGKITFGVRFKPGQLKVGRPPRQIVALQGFDKSTLTVARLVQNGPNATATFTFQPWQRSGTILANRLRDQYHEVVLTYDGSVQTTYFDGSPIGTETTKIDAIDVSGSELILSIGMRVDRRWQPFVGEIDAIVVGATSLSEDQIATVFKSPEND